MFANNLLFLAECRCPVDRLDLRIIARNYLLRQGHTVKQFKNSVPGIDWCLGFEERHPNISFRNVQNIKADRAGITEQQIRDYSKHLENLIAGVPIGNIFNFDESNLTDDPKSKKMLVRRGTKYPEVICNATDSF